MPERRQKKSEGAKLTFICETIITSLHLNLYYCCGDAVKQYIIRDTLS